MSRLGLGVTSFILWTVAEGGVWFSTSELAARADLSARTARKYLPRLHSAGLLDRANGKWIRIGNDEDINAAEEILIGGNKRQFVRYLLDQQVEWKQITDRIRDGKPQGGHSGKS
jgi:DNA-binding transcriptional regulator YhcF (GntR family)